MSVPVKGHIDLGWGNAPLSFAVMLHQVPSSPAGWATAAGLLLSASPGLEQVLVFTFKYNPRPQGKNVKCFVYLSQSGGVGHKGYWAAVLGFQDWNALLMLSACKALWGLCIFFPFALGQEHLHLLSTGERKA